MQRYVYPSPMGEIVYEINSCGKLNGVFLCLSTECLRKDRVWVHRLFDEYFETGGIREVPWDKLDLSWATEDMVKFYKSVTEIPPGSTVTYTRIAEEVWGDAKYRRKAAIYLRKNRFPIIIPCHRVWAKRGVGGYTPCGERMKIALVQHERKKWKSDQYLQIL